MTNSEIPEFQPAAVEPPAEEEAALLAALRAGEPEAYETLVRRHGPRMLAVARRFLGQEQDAQDAVQEAFLSAFKSIDRVEEGSRLGTWLHRIVVNAALMRIRKRNRRPERPIDDLLPSFKDDGHMAERAAPWAVTVDTAVNQRETREVVRRAIDQLPDSYRTILLLRDIEDHSTEETAELLEITPGAVKVRLHRARQALRTLLDPHMRGGEL